MVEGRDDRPRSGQILFEFTQVGQQMRVAAIDVATQIEVVVIAPLSASRLQMQTVAKAKLQRRLTQLHS
ncbi:MAG TPA: serine hydroxymethyltransferase [Devosiaceae bacterium]|jgi:hypothetical protein